MAEIEFKRRGTPLWAVVLVLLVIAGVLYALFGRGGSTRATADSTSAAAPTTSDSAAPSKVAEAPLTPLAAFAKWADTAKAPTDQAGAAAYVGQGVRMLGKALEERAPMAGAQHVLLRALADTISMPTTPAPHAVQSARLAFNAASYALGNTAGAQRIVASIQGIDEKKSLAAQGAVFKDAFRDVAKALPDSGKLQTLQPTVRPPAPPAGTKKP